jgi:serine/threonine-protein kinase
VKREDEAMAGSPVDPVERERRLDAILGEYLSAAAAGRGPDRQELIAGHPDLAGELAAFFADYDRLQRLANPLQPVAQAARAADPCTEPAPEPTDADAPGAAVTDAGTAPTLTADRPVDDRTTDFDERAVPADGDEAERPRGTTVRYFGDYELRRVLGRGGMGVVYQAKQLSLNRLVAVKMIRAGLWAGDDEVRRFKNEAEAVAGLDHPQIVPIYEIGTHEGQHYFSMKLVGDTSLAAQLPRFTADPKAAARLVAEVARAVHHAHQRGILHRDLKPSNILLDAEGRPHVTDFGLAKKLEGNGELSVSGSILGTPAYMSPEQAAGHRGAVTTATDLYGLGAILYASLTGRAPFQADDVLETLEQVREREPEKPSKLNPRLPRDLEVICLKCLEKDPRRRYGSADALADELERYLRGEPILARRTGPWERALKWARRRPALAGLAAALLVAVVAGSIASTVLWLRAERNYRNEQAARADAQARLGLAQEAIRTYYTGVSEDLLLKEPQMKALRDKLLGTALEFYKRLQESLQGNPDPKAQADLGEAYYRVGEITSMVGSRDDAKQAHRRALAIREKLAALYPDRDVYQRDLATSLYWTVAPAGAAVDEKERWTQLERARAIRERLASAHPENEKDQVALAEVLVQCAVWSSVHQGKGSLPAISRAGVECLPPVTERLERMAASSHSAIEIRDILADLLQTLSVYQCYLFDYDGADRSFQRAIELLGKDAAAPSERHLRSLFAVHWARTVEHQAPSRPRVFGERPEALQGAQETLRLAEKLRATNPAVRVYQYYVGLALSALGYEYTIEGRLADAEPPLRSSLSIFESVKGNGLMEDQLGYVHLYLGWIEGETGREAVAASTLRTAMKYFERGGVNDIGGLAITCGVIAELPGLADLRSEALEALVRGRDLVIQRERETGPDMPDTLPVVDLQITKLQRLCGLADAKRETIRRLESEIEQYFAEGRAWAKYDAACHLAELSGLVTQPGEVPSAAEKAQIQRYQERVMEWLQQTVVAGSGLPKFMKQDPYLISLHSRSDFQALRLDLSFPADPFAR